MLTYSEITIITDIVREVGDTLVLPRFRQDFATREKTSGIDIVTEVDVLAEHAIKTQLSAAFPGSVTIGEEECGDYPEKKLQSYGEGRVFLVDPIDGTKNYASGLPVFGSMVSVIEKEEIVGGVIYDPMSKEATLALRGEGAWTETQQGERVPLGLSSPKPVQSMVGLCSWMFLNEPMRTSVLSGLAVTAGAADFRCAAHHFRLLANGHYDFAFFGKVMPWDLAAGWLMHKELGGYSARLDGTPFSPTQTSGGLLLAPTEESWTNLRHELSATKTLSGRY